MKGFDWIFFAIMVPPLLLAAWELFRTGGLGAGRPKRGGSDT